MIHKDGGWQVKHDGGQKASYHTSTKKEAELQIHGKDMKIQRSDSHGNDPFPPKG